MTDAAAHCVRLRPATAGDRFLIRRWLRLPHVERWWGRAAATEAAVGMALASPSALCRMILWETEPIGYAHAVDASLWAAELPAGLPAGCWGIDLFIASPAHRGRGAGRHTLQRLTDEVFQTTMAVACAVVPPIANEAAVRTYERAGFRWQRIWHDPVAGPAWLMLLARPPR